jgi:hypothetical protein
LFFRFFFFFLIKQSLTRFEASCEFLKHASINTCIICYWWGITLGWSKMVGTGQSSIRVRVRVRVLQDYPTWREVSSFIRSFPQGKTSFCVRTSRSSRMEARGASGCSQVSISLGIWEYCVSLVLHSTDDALEIL